MSRSVRLGRWQSAVYAAEGEALAEAGTAWRRIEEARSYVDGLLEKEWFVRRWGHFVACAVERRGQGSRWSVSHPLDADGPGGLPTEGVVLVADGQLTQAPLLHELAHLLVPADAGHGPAFVAAQLELVREEMGFSAYAEYRACLQARLGEDLAGAA
jgi:putative metallohydrolase (TIGR04338 family)